jgi:hypothetical protein
VATLVFCLLIAGLSVAWVGNLQAQSGTVLGEVTNGTPGENVPEGLIVTLHAFSEMEETQTYTATVSEERSFRFEQISYEEGDTLVARVAYGGVTYVSEFATVEQGQETISLPVTIYETAEDPSSVAISQLHLFVDRVGEQIQVGAYAVIGNSANRTYVGSSVDGIRKTWSASLPEGATNLQFDGAELGARFIAEEDGFADTRPIPPGDASIETSFSYEIPLREGVAVEQSFDLPVRAVVLVVPEADWGLRGPDISSEGVLDTQMGKALSYTAGPLDAGELLAFTIAPRSSSAPEMPDAQGSSDLALGIGALVVAVVAVALMWRAPSPGPIPEKARTQVEAIAALDGDFEDGRLSEHSYLEKRRALKQQLRQTLSGQRR